MDWMEMRCWRRSTCRHAGYAASEFFLHLHLHLVETIHAIGILEQGVQSIVYLLELWEVEESIFIDLVVLVEELSWDTD